MQNSFFAQVGPGGVAIAVVGASKFAISAAAIIVATGSTVALGVASYGVYRMIYKRASRKQLSKS